MLQYTWHLSLGMAASHIANRYSVQTAYFVRDAGHGHALYGQPYTLATSLGFITSETCMHGHVLLGTRPPLGPEKVV